jgi:DNA-binding response OmpR family regulator
MKNILIIDDDQELCGLLEKLLSREGFGVEFENNSEKGLSKAISNKFQAVVLDVMMPDKNGFEVLREIRAVSSVPVLMLTARGDEIDRVVGLEIGADDYLPKPFSTRELIARINALFRRMDLFSSHGKVADSVNKIEVGDLEIIVEARCVKLGGNILDISTAEFDALLVLARSAGQVISRDEIAEAALGRRLSLFDRSVDMLISRLRRKLGNYPNQTERIRSIRNAGYLFVPSIETK